MRKAVLLLVLMFSAVVMGQSTQPSTGATDDTTAAIDAMRMDIVNAFNKGDVDRMLSHLDPDCVVTWQNGEVCHGPDEVRAYYNKMMTGPDKVVQSVSADPKVTERHIFGDWDVAVGQMHDDFQLTDGRHLPLNSLFTATLARRNGDWKIVAFHLSVNAFDNPVIHVAVTKVATWTGAIAGIVGLIVGLIVGRLGRRKSA